MDAGNIIEKAAADLLLIPELAFEESETKAYIRNFIRAYTDLELYDCGQYVYAVHREDDGPAILFRADFDAVPTACGPKHLCGHNGHTASLLGLALHLNGCSIGRNVILLFQPAEETGYGAPSCLPIFDKERIDTVVGAHNIPGEPLGTVLLKRGTFACASCGLEIKLTGKPTHAAYPENGVNPSYALANIMLGVCGLAETLSAEYGCMTLATPVGMKAGERAFGMAASEGALWITLRSEGREAYEKLLEGAVSLASQAALNEGLKLETAVFDEFPATVNDDALADEACRILAGGGHKYKWINTPFRWSEDFGHYSTRARSLFIGIGAGEDTAPLHTADYRYPEGLAYETSGVFFALAKSLGRDQPRE